MRSKNAALHATTGKIQVRGDVATRFQPGRSGNPAGRKQGSRNRLSEAFIAALAADFEANGPATIAEVRQSNPAAYLRICVSLVAKQVEIGPENPFADLTDAELDDLIQASYANFCALKSATH
jgi:hypothetical protein